MPFTLTITEVKHEPGGIAIAGKVASGAYFEPEAGVVPMIGGPGPALVGDSPPSGRCSRSRHLELQRSAPMASDIRAKPSRASSPGSSRRTVLGKSGPP